MCRLSEGSDDCGSSENVCVSLCVFVCVYWPIEAMDFFYASGRAMVKRDRKKSKQWNYQ